MWGEETATSNKVFNVTFWLFSAGVIGSVLIQVIVENDTRRLKNFSSISDQNTQEMQFLTLSSMPRRHQRIHCSLHFLVHIQHHHLVHCQVPDIIHIAKILFSHRHHRSQDFYRPILRWHNISLHTLCIREWVHLICIPRIQLTSIMRLIIWQMRIKCMIRDSLLC